MLAQTACCRPLDDDLTADDAEATAALFKALADPARAMMGWEISSRNRDERINAASMEANAMAPTRAEYSFCRSAIRLRSFSK